MSLKPLSFASLLPPPTRVFRSINLVTYQVEVRTAVGSYWRTVTKIDPRIR